MLTIKWVQTNNPERATWRYLQLFSKDSYVAQFVRKKTARDQIVSCVRQAEEIYSLAKSATLLTKPVLLYYGMQRLAKALIFLRNPNVNINDLKGHGLSGRGISDDIERFLQNRIPKTEKGIYPEFSKWTAKNNVLLKKTTYEREDYHHTDYFVHTCNIPDFVDASNFKVYDLMKLVPELIDLFHHFQMTNELLIFAGTSFRQHPNGKLDSLLTVEKKLDLDSLKTKFPTINEYDSFKEEQNRFVITSSAKDANLIPSPLVQSETKHTFLISSTGNSNRITDINVHFILMFFLCHIARYKAPLLHNITEGRRKSEINALIGRFIEVSETKFPKLILDELLGQYFVFRGG